MFKDSSIKSSIVARMWKNSSTQYITKKKLKIMHTFVFVVLFFHFHMCIYNLYKLQLSHVSIPT